MKIFDPVALTRALRDMNKRKVLSTFVESHYIPSIELLDMQVFAPNGFKLVCVREEDLDELY